MWMLGSDIGGTFTDLVAYDPASGALKFSKTLTNYDNLVDGVTRCLDEAEVDLAAVDIFKHGTTQVINALLERNGARTALITTAGFGDVLEIGRASRPTAFDLHYVRPAPLVPRILRYELPERIAAGGEVIARVDLAQLDRIVDRLRAAGVEAVAVSFLNSYRNPAHEIAVAAIVRDRLPEVFVSAGVELSREWFEYERMSTAVANAYVGPRAGSYVGELEARLENLDFNGKFYLMGSNGGALSATRSRHQPIGLVESGPIGGCIGAAALADQLGFAKVIAFDMGGTTTKCALVENGRFDVTPTYYVGGYERGFPVRTPVLDIVEISTGGGSIISVDRRSGISVGPRSAGSDPGPACFNRGGTAATLTDVNLFLGRIAGGAFLNGTLQLDPEIARRVIGETIGEPLGYAPGDMDRAAVGVLELASAQMSAVIREISVERGHDVRDFALCVFGGGGPLHGAFLARELQIRKLIVPPEPGNFSALGMLFADIRIESARTLLAALDAAGIARLAAEFAEMEQAILDEMEDEFGTLVASFERQASLRYVGQRQSLKLTIHPGDGAADVEHRYAETYRARYGHVTEGAEIEIVDLRVSGVAPSAKPAFDRMKPAGQLAPEPATTRPVYHIECRRWIDTPIYRRSDLAIGAKVSGPAVIEEFGSTTVIGDGDHLTVGLAGSFLIDIGDAA